MKNNFVLESGLTRLAPFVFARSTMAGRVAQHKSKRLSSDLTETLGSPRPPLSNKNSLPDEAEKGARQNHPGPKVKRKAPVPGLRPAAVVVRRKEYPSTEESLRQTQIPRAESRSKQGRVRATL
jgi:hypothetical protein